MARIQKAGYKAIANVIAINPKTKISIHPRHPMFFILKPPVLERFSSCIEPDPALDVSV